jgi:hypothetical protein
LYSKLVVWRHGWQVLSRALRTTVRHVAATLIESRLQAFKAMLVMLQFSYIFGVGAVAAEARDDQPVTGTPVTQPVSTGVPVARAQTDVPSPPAASPVLSAEAARVSQVAGQNGDKQFLMVDKVHGEVILFENGKPIFSGPALTGASMGDRVPPNVLAFSGSHPLTLDQKVTPAGRFTVTSETDPAYGRVWTINEIHGKDWDFAIHQVYLGFAAEHRDTRLYSANVADHHITYGCINVERGTIQTLAQHLPNKGKVPLYILPNDESLIAALFPLREPPSASNSVAATATNDHSR